ncbi:MAG: leucine-rich repeat domain-containing protein [Xenococcaceae cyanobacterium MO_207.B15]|nr:leucine-rich repeat domain-containing protein [Xenococcaceae cyanobacterium MO_207.B15]
MKQDNIPKVFQQRIEQAQEQQLEELDLSYDYYYFYSIRLTHIPDEVFELTHLKKLNLSNNNIKEIPSEIGRLTSLESLDLIGNKELTNISQELIHLPNLVFLRLTWNVNSVIPEWFSQIKQLGLEIIEQDKFKFPTIIRTIPDEILNLENLVFLKIWLRYSKDWIPWLQSLKELELNLSNNQLSALPEAITKLSNLTRLDLSNNQLSALPKSVIKLSNLTRLDLSNNQLSFLPESLGNFSNLTRLDLSANQLSFLPEFLGNFSNLTRLDLSRNQLSTLPNSLGNLSNLTRLDLSANQLLALPEALTKLSNLTRLYLSGNPLKTPPIEVGEQGIEAIRAYFRQLKEEGIDYIYEAKLLIVGEAGAGKTTLAKKIEYSNYQLNSNEKSTEGIDITKWSFHFLDKEKKEREFRVNIWDFGGQEIYHATHQFFLTKRSLYALVADTRKEDTDFYYWLNVVELLSNNSPLIIVKNQKDDRVAFSSRSLY